MAYAVLADVEAYMGQAFTALTVPTDTQVNSFIANAQSEVDLITSQTFEPLTTTDELIDFTRFEAFEASQSGFSGGNILPANVSFGRNDLRNSTYNSFKLEHKPIITLTSLEMNTGLPNGAFNITLIEDTDFILYKDIGRIILLQQTPDLGLRRFRATYDSGTTTVPAYVKRLTVLLAAREILNTKISNSNLQSVDSISIEGISITKSTGQGVSYLKNVQTDIDNLIKSVGVLETEIV